MTRSNLIRVALFISTAAFSFRPVDAPQGEAMSSFLIAMLGTTAIAVFTMAAVGIVDRPGKWRWPTATSNPLGLRRRPLEQLLAFALVTWGIAAGAIGYAVLLQPGGHFGDVLVFAGPALGSVLALLIVHRLWKRRIERDALAED